MSSSTPASFRCGPLAREKLAKVAGIVSGHPGLRLDVEGHTDSVGGDDYNQQLSEQRGDAVRDYLTQQGMAAGSVTAKGFGKTQPVASNDTAAGPAAESARGTGDLRRGNRHGDRQGSRSQVKWQRQCRGPISAGSATAGPARAATVATEILKDQQMLDADMP